MSSPTYNFIYSKLVAAPDDLVGLIAYGLYKREKIEFIARFKDDHSNDPTDADLAIFHSLTNTDSRRENYRSQAEGILASFSNKMLEEITGKIQDEYEDTLIEELKKAQPFWRGVGQNLVSSVATLAIIALFFFIIWSMRFGVSDTLGTVFNVDITSKVSTTNQQAPK